MSLLDSIAETKQFDVYGSGMDSNDCVLAAPAYKVFTYASMKKDYAIAMKEAYKT
jgi:hypothetical protein